MNTLSIQRRVKNEVRKHLDTAAKFYGTKFNTPETKFAVKGGCAGRASPSKWSLDFNMELLKNNEDDFIARTVPHEVAHLVDSIINPHNLQPRRGKKRVIHGRDFKYIMETVLGADDSSRCHSYNVSGVSNRKTRHVWRCMDRSCNSKMTIGPTRHKKLLKDNDRYRPRGCSFNHRVSYFGVEGKEITMMPSPKNDQQLSHNIPQRSAAGSIKDQARAIFVDVSSRKEFIDKAAKLYGIKSTTAGTYYYNFSSGKW